VNSPLTPLTHGLLGSETITSKRRRALAKYAFASSTANAERGSSKTRRLAG
jgi:hypothetical protein